MGVYTTVLRLQPRILVMLAVLWGIVGLLESNGWTVDTEQARESLRGLAGVQVVIESLAPEAERAGLTTQQLQTDVELRLRQAGIPVLMDQERRSTPGAPYLYVRVTTLKSNAFVGLLAFYIDIVLDQTVFVEHNSSHVYATTWDTPGSIGMFGVSQFPIIARNNIRDLVDRFINAYLSVNPRPAGSATPSPASPRRDLIRQVQERLQTSGFNPGAIDGAMGPQTRDALRWFQNAKGIQATGELDEATLDALGVR